MERSGRFQPACFEKLGLELRLSRVHFPQIFVHLGRETAQERLRNGWRNGRVLATGTANASPRGEKRSWGFALPSDQASRRSSPARDKGPPGPFSPTLYLKVFHHRLSFVITIVKGYSIYCLFVLCNLCILNVTRYRS